MKKIISLIAVSAIIISILNISAFATSEPSAMTVQEFYSAQSSVVDKWVNGEITYSEWYEQQNSILDEFYSTNQSLGDSAYATALAVGQRFRGISQKIGKAVDEWGDGARERVSDWWNSVCNQNNVPTEATATSNIDYRGYGAVIVKERYVNNKLDSITYDYADYFTFTPNGDSYKCSKSSFLVMNIYNSDGTFSTSENKYGSTFSLPVLNGYNSNFNGYYTEKIGYFLYGDVRFNDGIQAETSDVWEYGTIKKFDDMSERDLEDLLNDFAEEMELQNPDLSTIEGLLNAIYARMGTLDSDNDNDLLASINANILALLEADNKKDEDEDSTNEELIKTLLEIRDSLKNGTLGTAPSSHGHEISGTVYNVIPLDKNFLNKLFHDTENLKVEYEGKVYYLEDCGCLKLGDKYYTPNMNYDSYTFADYDFSNNNIDLDDTTYLGFKADSPLNLYNNLSFKQRKKVDNIVNAIYQMVTYSIPYAAITTAFAPFEVIIFNTAVPEDIVLNFNGTDEVGGFSATVLSVSFFQNQYVASAMGIVKPFLTVVIGYCWLKVMRRKVVSM